MKLICDVIGCGDTSDKESTEPPQSQIASDNEQYLPMKESPSSPSNTTLLDPKKISRVCATMLRSFPLKHITPYYQKYDQIMISEFLFHACQIRWMSLHQQIHSQRLSITKKTIQSDN